MRYIFFIGPNEAVKKLIVATQGRARLRSPTHIAKFVCSLSEQIKPLFSQVLMTCDAQGLIGRELFAIDGVKLPSNASKERSGTLEELRHRAERLDNLRYNKRLTRLNHRGKTKVNTQWNLYCMVHNIEKLANNGYARL